VAGNIVGGALADRGVVRAIFIALAAILVVLVLFALLASNPIAALVLTFFIGLSGVALTPALQIRLMDVADDAQTLAAALNHSALNIANAGGAWLGGLVIAAGYSYRAPSLLGAGLAVAGLLVLGLALLYGRRTAAKVLSRPASKELATVESS
jgi:DHA1 family inner membrane transport protein